MTVLGIDWGTTNRRAYLLNSEGDCIKRHEDERGMLAERGRFAWSLSSLRATMEVDASVPIIMSGMIGSAQGWQEVPYLNDSVAVSDLPRHLAPLHEMPGCFIVPGYMRQGLVADVMRGEETQMLGALALGHCDGWFVLPGTHSKWVCVENGRMTFWSTYMTGELYATLGRDGTLAALLQMKSEEKPEDFDAGLALAEQRLPLSSALFSVRSAVVTGRLNPERVRAYISGLLIGSEFVFAASTSAAPSRLRVLASSNLAARYSRAAEHFGIAAELLDPHQTYCAALRRCLNGGEIQ
ncbi:2-dehydro-3-deoxygalactonokinase [Duganella sp. PWIR1]